MCWLHPKARTTTICVQNGREAYEENLQNAGVESKVFAPLLRGCQYELLRSMHSHLLRKSKSLLQDHI